MKKEVRETIPSRDSLYLLRDDNRARVEYWERRVPIVVVLVS